VTVGVKGVSGSGRGGHRRGGRQDWHRPVYEAKAEKARKEKRWDPLKIETHGGGERNFGPRIPASLEKASAKMR